MALDNGGKMDISLTNVVIMVHVIMRSKSVPVATATVAMAAKKVTVAKMPVVVDMVNVIMIWKRVNVLSDGAVIIVLIPVAV